MISYITNWWSGEKPSGDKEKEKEKDGPDLKASDLREFNLSRIQESSVILILGDRRTGKTSLCKTVLNELAAEEKIIINPTEAALPQYGDDRSLVSCSVFKDTSGPEFNLSEYIKKRQSTVRDENRRSHRSLIVLDEVEFTNAEKQTEQMEQTELKKNVTQLFLNGRHLKTTLIMSRAQSSTIGLAPAWRGNVDYVFLFPPRDATALKKLYEQYGGGIPTYNRFVEAMEACRKADRYASLVIDRTKRDTYISMYIAPNRILQ